MMLSRRKLIGSLISLVAAPAIVRVSSIMPVKTIEDWRSGLYTEYSMNNKTKAALNECYDIINRAMREMMFRDHEAIGFAQFEERSHG